MELPDDDRGGQVGNGYALKVFKKTTSKYNAITSVKTEMMAFLVQAACSVTGFGLLFEPICK